MANLVADHYGPSVGAVEQCGMELDVTSPINMKADVVNEVLSTMFFDGSSYDDGCKIGLFIILSRGARFGLIEIFSETLSWKYFATLVFGQIHKADATRLA